MGYKIGNRHRWFSHASERNEQGGPPAAWSEFVRHAFDTSISMALSRRSLAILPRDQSRANDYSNGFAIQGVVAGVRKRKRPRMNRHMRNTPQTSIPYDPPGDQFGTGASNETRNASRISFISKQLSL